MRNYNIIYLASIHEPGKILYAVGLRDEIEGSVINRIEQPIFDSGHFNIYFENGNLASITEAYVIVGRKP